jgi:hypothetical protein
MRPGIAQFAWILQFRHAVGSTETTGAALLFTPISSSVAAVGLASLSALCLTELLAVAWIRRASAIRVVQAVFGR